MRNPPQKSSWRQRLRKCVSGVATTEMALALPFFLTGGLWGAEVAYYGVANMKVSQLAVHLADNASRIGDASMLENRKIYESDINDILLGAHLQSGSPMDLYHNGRVIISSLEVDEDGNQYIHWQRCMGKKSWESSYGDEGQRLDIGMGPKGDEVIAFPDEAVMFVEIAYEYQPLVSDRFVGQPTIKAISSFTVRADRDLTEIYQRDPPADIADCDKFENAYAGVGRGPAGPMGGGGSSSGGGSSGGPGGASSGGASSGGAGGASSGGGGKGKSGK